MIKKFSQFINEAKDQLDISIKAVGKYVTNDKKRDSFLSDNVTVEHKTDGIKITLIYINNTGDYTKDWIVSYKGEVQYPGEFDFASDTMIKKSSIANAQFQIIFNHLKKVTPGISGLSKDTEFFVEFLMRKPTLSSSYKRQHGMVLIAYSPTTYTNKMGKLKSSPSAFNVNDRNKYADIIGLDVPAVLFEGVLGNQSSFEKSIKMKELKTIYNQRKSSFSWNNPELLINDLREMFLEVESVYGNLEEGVVLNFHNGIILKFQQEYQIDQEARKKIKDRYNEDTEDKNNLYWKQVRLTALDIIMKITAGPIVEKDFSKYLKKAADELKKTNLNFKHSKRDITMIKDDIQGNIKMILRKRLKDNNNFLFLGKFRVLTEAHYKIIEKGLKDYDGGVVCVVTSKDTKFSKDLRNKMVQTAFPKIEIVNHSTGNLFGIMGKADKNINIVLAGSDRVSDYKHTLSKNPDLSVVEIARTDDDTSATKVIENIEDEKYFKTHTHKSIHKMYKEILETYKN